MACLQKALSYTSYETSSMKFVDDTQGMDEEYELRIHCEVALTLYIREHWKGPQKNIYLGCSKLSCMACYCFLQGNQGNHGDQFCDQGMPPKVVLPMGFPPTAIPLPTSCSLYCGRKCPWLRHICSWLGISANILR
ncbi:hypothetical protein L211DRAFT_405911 [Terfezia boudieri ATCC MYA-4762]|uniref:Uncharacterized protein n=1 Tax=Terfezia boudieri ATCC MYA-4762 TaxID=1051890 RepID=A0A3N4M0P3_9PEZI|nr:hypothetical protein L211DRAFT_405911 [Terfezia boudieri ATCC MYA-4762]